MVEYHSKLLMLSNLAFQMKFKYTSLLVNSLYYLPLGHKTFLSSPEPISTKPGTKYPLVKGIQVCSNEGPCPFQRGDNYEITKIH